ncbi:MAG: hypothetical protein HWE27_16175 [Gammaproteobacteria bacterium]|nr:hypothetical protein [Gammaproteobacteria bacterium]
MFFNKSKKKHDLEKSIEQNEPELLDLEDEILSETGGGTTAPNIGCGVNDPEEGSN